MPKGRAHLHQDTHEIHVFLFVPSVLKIQITQAIRGGIKKVLAAIGSQTREFTDSRGGGVCAQQLPFERKKANFLPENVWAKIR